MQKNTTRYLLALLIFQAGLIRAECADQPFYVDPSAIDLIHILAPPPAPGSSAATIDIQTVRNAQKQRTAADITAAQADAELSVFRFADVLGVDFKAENLPLATQFFERISCDENRAVGAAKKYFNRPRPFVNNLDIKPVVAQPPNASYPSGHATFAYVDAIILAALVPEKSAAIFQRAADYANHRIVAGVHYPTDIEAGRIAGSVIDNVLLHDPRFIADLKAIRTEIRGALKLTND